MSSERVEQAKALAANTRKWPMFADGYQVCPFCICIVHPVHAEAHPERCWAYQQALIDADLPTGLDVDTSDRSEG